MITSAPGRITKGMRTLPCKECGQPYTDRIDPRVDPANGGYIICAYCAMGVKRDKAFNEKRNSRTIQSS